MRTKNVFWLLLAVLVLLAPALLAQTITTGEITGVVSDSSGAVVPDATVTLANTATGETRTVQSGPAGNYRFTLLKPAPYKISATSPGMKSDILSNVIVSVGQVVNMPLVLKPQEAKEVVMVTDAAPLLQTDTANVTSTFTTRQFDLLPMPGGDITTVAFTVPGVVVSTGAGYGNFSSNGLPGTANLYTMNGNDNMDPYLNLNNSGASNLTLGANELQEASVVQNAYTGQYGRNAGAQLNFVTKSGTNDFHGNLLYNYNGSFMNANDFFSNQSGTPRGRALSHQYGASMGGRVVRDKVFFFVDHESLRYILPSSGFVSVPSQALQKYVLGSVSSAQKPFYQKMFDLYNNAPGRNRAVPVVNGDGNLQDSNGAMGCGGLAGTPVSGGVLGETISCADAFGTNVSNQNTEWLLASRVDWNMTDKQRMFFRFKTDQGLQPTFTDPINPIFNSISKQPAYEGQINHTWIATPNVVNNFVGSSSYYSAIFGPADLKASLNAFPVRMEIWDGGANGVGGMTELGVQTASYPQGRRVGQLGLVDDVTYTKNRHTLKFGVNYRYNRVTDTGNQRYVYGGRYYLYGLDELAAGEINPTYGSYYAQRYTPYPVVHLRVYNVGFYVEDAWAVTPTVKLTASLRVERTGNPSCTDDCFARMTSPWSSIQKGSTIPYNQTIQTGLNQAFYSSEGLMPQARIGLAWNPSWAKGTVIRGGFGMFSDLFPATVAGNVFGNSPNVFTPQLRAGTIDAGGPGSAPAISQATGAAFTSKFAGGATLSQLQQALQPVTFTPPAYFTLPSEVKNNKYMKWSFEIQHEISAKNVLTLSYVGNRGYDLFTRNLGLNGSYSSSYANGFDGLPSAAPDPRFRIITDLRNTGWSNYNGLSASFRRGFGYGFQGELSYTWSHALDTISNGGYGLVFGGDSFSTQLNPFDLRALNYSNADYDIRHNVTADFLWEMPFKLQNRFANAILSGWSIGDKLYSRTGTPFTVYNSRIAGRVGPTLGGSVLAEVLNPNVNTSCGAAAVDTPCFKTSDFNTYTKQTTFGNLPRNSFRGPGYFDTDFTVYKTIPLHGERMKFTVGLQALNLFNHPNFASPGWNAGVSGLGIISSTVTPPTSPYGSFQGSAVSGRVVVLNGRLAF